jgi:hypothetical protein
MLAESALSCYLRRSMRWLDDYRPRDARCVVFYAGRGSGGLGDRLVGLIFPPSSSRS